VSPIGLKPAPKHAPRRLRNTEDLRTLQRLMTHAVVRPLTASDGLQKTWIDGRPTAEVAAEFIKPNDRLTAFERLQLYNRMYWFRLIDCVSDDNPGLQALLGEKKFSALVRAFLAKYPSRSFTLRNLCSRLEQFILEAPQWTAPRTALAAEIARFEWARTVAFDGEEKAKLVPEQLAGTPPTRLRLGLQPYITLLTTEHAVDEYVMAIKQRETLRATASNTSDGSRQVSARARKLALPKRERVWLAVHRLDHLLYYKRLEAPAFRILQALAAGRTLSQAVVAAGPAVTPEQVQSWFTTWMELGWFCRRK
jgi:hypothetical protein